MTETTRPTEPSEIASSLSDICGPEFVSVVEARQDVLGNGQKQPLIWAEPADEAQVSDIMKCAGEKGWAIKPVGGGTQLAGDGCRGAVDVVISLRRMNQVLAFSPEDLVVTVQPGVTLESLQQVLAKEEKMLPLDPWLPVEATIGGIAATAVSGPKRALYGTVRDMAIALRVVYPDGTVVRTGSKVVKNVAGYDMTKLFVGSRGTLAIITELTFKLRPLPLHRETVLLEGRTHQVNEIRARMVSSTLIPARAEAIAGQLSNAADELAVWQLAVDCDENELASSDQTHVLQRWAEETGMACQVLQGVDADTWWAQIGRIADRPELVLRISAPPTQWHTFADAAAQMALAEGFQLRQSWGVTVGVGRIFVDSPNALADETAAAASAAESTVSPGSAGDVAFIRFVSQMRTLVAQWDGSAVIERASVGVRREVDPFGPAAGAQVLFERIKGQIDPGRVMSPVSFAGGI